MSRPLPLISFIVPIYDLPADLLQECLDSILAVALDADEREIIIVDDGSTVPCWELLDETYHSAAIYVRQEHEGQAAARNRGLSRARGLFVQFVDGDDALVPRGYNLIIKKVRQRDSYVPTDILFFRYGYTPTPRRGIASWLNLFWYLSNREYLSKKNVRSGVCGYIFRRDRLQELRFPAGIYHEDEEFTPLLVLRCPYVLFTAITAYYYRRRAGSTMLSTDREHLLRRQHDMYGVLLRLRHTALHTAPALMRHVDQMTMDYIYNVLRQSADYGEFHEMMTTLTAQGLAPLPLRRYTIKYLLFALLTHGTAGQRLLYLLLH